MIGMLVQGFVRSFGAIDRLRLNTTINFFAAFQCRGQTLAGFPDFFSGHVE